MKLNFSFCLFLMISMVLVSSMAHAGIQLWDFDNIGNEADWEEANGDWKFTKGIFQETSGGEAAGKNGQIIPFPVKFVLIREIGRG
jgi:hypothetical protein